MSTLTGFKKETGPKQYLVRTLAIFPIALFAYSILLEVRFTFQCCLRGVCRQCYRNPKDVDADLDTAWSKRPKENRILQDYSKQLVDLNIPVDAEFVKSVGRPRVAIVTTTSGNVESTKLWIKYHSAIGISDFYLFTDGQANHENARRELERWSGVKVFGKNRKLEYIKAHSRAWNETWLAGFFNKPCNHELFVNQTLHMEVGLKQGFKDGIDWIIHLDTDELIYPGDTPDYNIQQLLNGVDRSVDVIVFPNYEALPEHGNVVEPFLESSLFKKNFAHVRSDQYFKNYHIIAKGNPNYFVAYGNGKSAARLSPGIRPNGAHRWYYYTKRPKEITSDHGAILHYVYNKYSDLKGRRDRCDCAPTEEDTRRCFMLPFDREAFIKSSLLDDEQLHAYFLEHLIWSNQTSNFAMMKNGLVIREHTPQILMRLFKQLPNYGLKPADPKESKATVVDEFTIPKQ